MQRDPDVQRLMTLLQTENNALIAGDHAVLDTLANEKTALFHKISVTSTPAADLGQIKAELARNQALIGAAIAGLRAAQKRIAALHQVRGGLQVYDHAGQMAPVAMARSAVVRKA
jgi:hypothetical protein